MIQLGREDVDANPDGRPTAQHRLTAIIAARDVVLDHPIHQRLVGGVQPGEVVVGVLALLGGRGGGDGRVGVVEKGEAAVGLFDGAGIDVPRGVGAGAAVYAEEGERIGGLRQRWWRWWG